MLSKPHEIVVSPAETDVSIRVVGTTKVITIAAGDTVTVNEAWDPSNAVAQAAVHAAGTVPSSVPSTDGPAINPATGQPVTQVPGFVSDLASMLTGKQGQTTPQGGSTTEREVREQYSLPGHSNVTASATRKVVDLNGQGPSQVHVTTAKAGVHRIKMAGLPSGALNGVVALIEGGVERQVGDGNLDSTDFFTKPMTAGETFTISLDKRGGDDKTELAIEPQ